MSSYLKRINEKYQVVAKYGIGLVDQEKVVNMYLQLEMQGYPKEKIRSAIAKEFGGIPIALDKWVSKEKKKRGLPQELTPIKSAVTAKEPEEHHPVQDKAKGPRRLDPIVLVHLGFQRPWIKFGYVDRITNDLIYTRPISEITKITIPKNLVMNLRKDHPAFKHGQEAHAKVVKKWMGSKPDKCDICKQDLKEFFVDGKTKMGPWGLMCPTCHDRVGVGLGTGHGQKYDLRTLEKIEGGWGAKVEAKYTLKTLTKSLLKPFFTTLLATSLLLHPTKGEARFKDPKAFGKKMEELAQKQAGIDVEVKTMIIKNQPGKPQIVKWTFKDEDTGDYATLDYIEGGSSKYAYHKKPLERHIWQSPNYQDPDEWKPRRLEIFVSDFSETLNNMALQEERTAPYDSGEEEDID